MSTAPDAPARTTYPRPLDLSLVPLEFDDGARLRSRFVLGTAQARPDGVLYGGAAVAAAVTAMEAATGRDALWVTTQFVAPARVGDVVDCEVQVMAQGRRIAQLQFVARVGDEVVFGALGATAQARPDGLEGQFETMREARPPDQSEPRPLPSRMPVTSDGYYSRTEFREAAFVEPHPPGVMGLWARLRTGEPLTPAAVAFLADMVPVAVARGAGKLGAGTSLDNTIRFGPAVATEWVLLELHGQLAAGGYGHGSFTAWTPDGVLVATGSQTASMNHIFGSI